MEYSFKVKKQVSITLELSPEELNTLVCGFGATDQDDRLAVAERHGLEIVDWKDSDAFYSKIKRAALEVKEI